ncbi:hypothetical protein QA640_45660 (plasmid) [Bradyrhizobium sp. CB82]|uniref:hypothetical protein n=1 Tax=Bradyrhizobium sp. CB82 TaxID=3039159 RepID=UPI0024B0FB14|nr:hypothetical protein [Bradyrhizobium sp. CB82]WFU46053.1 hypothetical protein QA640_45660 [Bradyrhizobium sp. CB82]
MKDKKLLASTLREAGKILREHREMGSRNPATTIQQLIDLLDTPELLSGLRRVRRSESG